MRKRPNGRASYAACNVRTPIAMGGIQAVGIAHIINQLNFILYGLQSNERKSIFFSI